MRKVFVLPFTMLFAAFALAGCSGSDLSGEINDVLSGLEDDYLKYAGDKKPEPPPSVLDAIDLMLDHFVSGTSTPEPSSIPSTVLDPDGHDAQDIISGSSSVVFNEAELEAVIFQAIKNADDGICFESKGDWLDTDILYDIVFERIHDVYMIDAFGLYSYVVRYTSNGVDDFYELDFIYIDNKSQPEILEMRNEIENKAKQIVTDLNMGGKSDHDKIAAIDQYLCDNVYYPQKPYIPLDHTPYGTMFDGRAVCEGYARTVKILCDLCNVDCYYVTGYCGNDPVSGGHAWNLVGVDGKWYQLDTTWNDGGNDKTYFLVTDDFMSLSRNWDRSRYPATEKKNYA